MSNQLICDECGEPIDTSKAYYTLTGQKMQVVVSDRNSTPTPTAIETPITLDYHEDHVPVYKVAGEPVETPVGGDAA